MQSVLQYTEKSFAVFNKPLIAQGAPNNQLCNSSASKAPSTAAQQVGKALGARVEMETLRGPRPHLIHPAVEMQSDGRICTQRGAQCARALVEVTNEHQTCPKR